ncbi:ABC transporter substrate-binding protein [Salinicola acroporae]|uniref:Spermidine/putrescine ABC transporter substrate-binding protein n=1 Tax=Salinicola acroporae TaxID=1541440 RepID=A0ABT6IA64_9GAMM|nr:extracellular solute-binding protein [Salinicola acroporae]MDH4573980.1 spermidine/putrescine ABC transporter substrate-binding protein [Salinicola acroporae]
MKGYGCIRSIALVAGLATATGLAQADTIRVLNWQGYGTDEDWSLEQFEKATGNTVEHEYFNSEQEMLTKLRTNPGTYDVVLVNSAYTQQAAKEGLIQPLDLADYPHSDGLQPRLARNSNLLYDGKLFGVAWLWGVTSFAINTGAFDAKPNSIMELWNPAHAGRLGWRDDAVESCQFAALATGQDINDPSDYDLIRERLHALKPQIRTFWNSENEWNQYMASGEFDLATYWSGSAARSKNNFGLPIEFIVPREGAIAWLDGLSLPTDAPHPEAAKQFIDWMIDPEFYVQWDTEVGAPISANEQAVAQLPDGAFNKTLIEELKTVNNLPFMGPMSDATREKMLEVWQETKTFYQE